jgi:hypothetical protein
MLRKILQMAAFETAFPTTGRLTAIDTLFKRFANEAVTAKLQSHVSCLT